MMPVWTLLLLGALSVVLTRIRAKNPAVFTPIMAIVLIVAVWGAVGRLRDSETSAIKDAQALISESVGDLLGREVEASVPEHGAVAVVRLSPVSWVGHASTLEAEVRGLRALLEPRYTIHVVHLPDPPSDEIMPAEVLSESELRSLIAQVPGAKAVILQRATFEPARNGSPDGLPPIFVILGEPGLTDRLLKGGFVKAAVDHKAGADWEAVPTRKMSLEQIFGLRYQITRP